MSSMSFFDQVGPMAIGSRLRRVSELITEDARRLYELYGVGLQPKWWPVFHVLSSEESGLSTSEIARRIGHSHASVSQICSAMTAAGLLTTEKSDADGRVNVIRLTAKASEILPVLRVQCADVGEAVDELLAETEADLWGALGALERCLEERSLFDRVKESYKQREDAKVEVVDFRPEHAEAFRQMNLNWITRHWDVEDADRLYLEHPKEKILDPGGAILMALYDGEAVGTVALVSMGSGSYELAKMAVEEHARGKGIGWRLGSALLDRARDLGGTRVYLESNTILEPAINLYRKLGFEAVQGGASPYDRCNIQMEVWLAGDRPSPDPDMEPEPEADSASSGVETAYRATS